LVHGLQWVSQREPAQIAGNAETSHRLDVVLA
jgi:hypothetical protein